LRGDHGRLDPAEETHLVQVAVHLVGGARLSVDPHLPVQLSELPVLLNVAVR
jgi:hypothetical protein